MIWKGFKLKVNKQIILAIVFGQILSIFICGTAVSSGYLSQIDVAIPVTQSFLNYLLIAFTYGMFFTYQSAKDLSAIIKSRGYIYLIASLIDVEANYLIVKAYQYTNVTSVQLLDCLTIPTVFILSIFVFRIRYLCSHFIGVCLCIVGSIGLVLIDHFTKNSSVQGSYPLFGDLLVVVGAICYGTSNVLQDYMVKKYDRIEYLGFLGIFSSVISGIQILIIERSAIASAFSTNSHNMFFWLSMVGFALSMYLLYSLMPYVMQISSAVVTNLSLLTADIYALFVGIFLFGNSFHPLYFLTYITIMFGVGVYVCKSPVKRDDNEKLCDLFPCQTKPISIMEL